MDKLTDILTTFFVTESRDERREQSRDERRERRRRLERHRGVEKRSVEVQTDILSEVDDTVYAKKMIETIAETDITSVSGSVSSSASVSSNPPVSPPVSVSAKKRRAIMETVVESETSSLDEPLPFEATVVTDTNADTVAEPVVVEPESEGDSVAEPAVVELKRYILKASEFYKKNIVICNSNIKECIETLSDMLYNLTLMKNIEETYNNTVYIITSVDNKKYYKRMWLNNPYLFFNDCVIKTRLTKRELDDICKSEKRSMVIVDFDSFNNTSDIGACLFEQTKKVHLLFTVSDYTSRVVDLYEKLDKDKLFIYKRENYKSLQKKVYSKIISRLVEKPPSFDDYFRSTNENIVGIRYIIMKNNELRYY
jgi:hypothetical protein